ncbi:MAG: hypothetical protein CBC42_05435 [Betaproteobacteria bacterium TMED82]|nr:MAG: hypothetical protein CBC42_05435 [Betaproteobacteria bacterium TMED82]
MAVINTNTKALFTQAALISTERNLSKSMEQLSTGKRINTAGDDAAGLAISTRMTQQIRALDQAVRNAGDAVSLIQTAEGATNEITDMLQRMRELSIQAINDTNANEDRSYLDLEFQQLKKEIVRIADMTEWNGFQVLNGSAGDQVGPEPVFKITSTGEFFSDINYSPVTKNVSENVAQHKLIFSDASAAQQSFNFGSYSSSATGLTFNIQTRGASGIDPLTTSIHLGSIEQVLTFSPASNASTAVGTAGFKLELDGRSAGDAAASYSAAVTFSVTANTSQAVAANAVSAINAVAAFTADGHLAIDNGDGTVTIRWASANTIGSQYTTTITDTSATGVTLTAASCLPVNNTSAEIAAVVASALNTDFSTNKIYRAASHVAGSSGVTLTYRAADGDPLDPIKTGDTTGSNFTAVDVKSTGNIYIGGVTVQIAPGTTANNIASQVQAALQTSFAAASATQARVVVNNGSGTVTITYPDESPSVSLISYSADTNVGLTTDRDVVQVVDTSVAFSGTGEFLKAGELTLSTSPEPSLQRTVTFGPAMTASQQILTFGAWSAGPAATDNNTFSITTKGGSSTNALVTQINLGTVTQTLNFGGATNATSGIAASSQIGIVLTDHNNVQYSVQVTGLNSADSARSVACDFVSAANATFSAAGVSYNAIETSAGEVLITYSNSSSITLSSFTAAISAGGTGVTLAAASATVQNNTTAAVSSIIATQLNASFSANGVLRRATDLGDGTGAVKLVYATTDNIPLTATITSTTTGIDLSVGTVTQTGGTITVDGVSVELSSSAGLTANSIATQVKAALFANSNYDTASGRTLSDNGSGALTITYSALDGEVADLVVSSNIDSANPRVTSTVNENRDYGTLDATFELENGGNITLRGAPNFSAGTIYFARDSVAQQDTFTLSGDYKAGDILEFKVDEVEFKYTVTTADVNSSSAAYTNAIANKTIVSSIAEAMSENVQLSELVTASVARDLDITTDDETYLVLTSIEAGKKFTASSVLTRIDGTSTSLISSETSRFNVDAGNNSLLISDDMTISLLGADGNPESFTQRGPKVTVDINRQFSELTALRSSDLIINGETVNLSLGKDDNLSPTGINQAGSAIAKAEAINRISSDTGVTAVVGKTVMTGTAMKAGGVVSGTLTINGFSSPIIQTINNNIRESRSVVVEAINRMTKDTGVIAINTNDDNKGVRLEAKDGRNIEIAFNSAATDSDFSDRTGLKQGVQSGVYSLESKYSEDPQYANNTEFNNPIVLQSSTTGEIERSGLQVGTYNENISTIHNNARESVSPALSQISKFSFSGTLSSAGAETFNVIVNGKSKSYTTESGDGIKDIRKGLIEAIESDPSLGITVLANYGNDLDEVYVTARNPGIDFTATVTTDASDAYIDVEQVRENFQSPTRKLNNGDLIINGVAIRGSDSEDDDRSVEISSSSKKDASAIAIAAAINSHSEVTGVTAEIKAAKITGSTTNTGFPGVFPATGDYDLYINGIKTSVRLTQDEPADTRRNNVVSAINLMTHTHGVVATNNNQGVTLESSDGRNMSVWFDGSIQGLSAASFGLDQGEAVAQTSTITLGQSSANATLATGDTIALTINGVQVTAQATSSSFTGFSDTLKLAIDEAANDNPSAFANTSVSIDPLSKLITIISTNPGIPFEISGAYSSSNQLSLDIVTTTENSLGNNEVTGIRSATAASLGARTVYSDIKLVSKEQFSIEPGDNGFGQNSSFTELGFVQGTFGGEATLEVSPPRVGRLAFQVGARATQIISIDLGDFGKGGPITNDVTGDVDDSLEKMKNRINSRSSAEGVLERLDKVMDKVNANRANMGAVINRLTHAIDNLSNVSTNQSASRSQIMDADYAKASTELARSQILQQAGTAILAQANASQQVVLQLLQG